ncbi:DedA family protein [Streptomyces sp. NBC_01217]|uniref:DedA family protein n=1 Tax=Streptomyces sp. NBC_01217 TaxID=2903779 RepID=UPI003FA38FF0
MAIVLARYAPPVRTVLNPLGGCTGAPVRAFTVWQIASGVVWSVGLTLDGYALGSSIQNVVSLAAVTPATGIRKATAGADPTGHRPNL